ncbi:uncharacterized protein LOC126696484 [Quercus robur]|uniref:uncharacterized protein LOC126696484 n=1 Tax=Quercus robur TaxID=38942 RepID=UPI00216257F8|nr:uncharacterized protein LOC126696484 [Quercus robur]
MSSAYHPQSDGQTKVVNKSLEQCLRAFARDKPKQWVEWLPLAEFWLNTNYHTATKLTPFEALYGFQPPKLLNYIPGLTKAAVVEEYLQTRQQILSLLKTNLVAAQDRMKLQKIGHVAYMFDLPPTSGIHPVFHISCLKAKLGQHINPIPTLPPVDSQGHLSPEPIAILQQRPVQLRKHRSSSSDSIPPLVQFCDKKAHLGGFTPSPSPSPEASADDDGDDDEDANSSSDDGVMTSQ